MIAVGALLNLVGGAGALVPALSSIPYVGPVIGFFRSPAGRVIGVLLIAAAVWGHGYWRGAATQESRCEAAALRAEIAGLKIERDAANGRAERAAARITELQRVDSVNQDKIAELQAEVAKQSPQSTQVGARHDPRALYDDRCNLTDFGRRRLRE